MSYDKRLINFLLEEKEDLKDEIKTTIKKLKNINTSIVNGQFKTTSSDILRLFYKLKKFMKEIDKMEEQIEE